MKRSNRSIISFAVSSLRDLQYRLRLASLNNVTEISMASNRNRHLTGLANNVFWRIRQRQMILRAKRSCVSCETVSRFFEKHSDTAILRTE